MVVRWDDPVRLVMGLPVATIETTATLREAAVALRDEQVGALAVMSPAGFAGVLSERDVTRAIADHADPDVIRVGGLMAEHPIQAEPGDSVLDSLLLMVAAGVRHLPVTTEGKVVGMLSIRDLIDPLIPIVSSVEA